MENNFPPRKLLSSSPDFPRTLLVASDDCRQLYVRGVLSSFSKTIAIVGTRKASPRGIKMAHDIASACARGGYVVVSGLAFGIDAAAHRGALDAGGTTWAVLAGGIDKMYPRSHESLGQSILSQGGAIISEYEPGTPFLAHQFILRNRIISGLCEAVIIIEAPKKSGAITTAQFALNQGKKVFAVSGSPQDKNYQGSHTLIRRGARLIASCDDLCEDLNISPPKISKTDSILPNLSPEEKTVLLFLKESGKATVDKIAEVTKLKPQEVQRILSSMLMAEIIEEETPGNFRADAPRA